MDQGQLDRIEAMLARLVAEREGSMYLTSEQLAERIHTSLSTLARWRRDGTGPAFTRIQNRPVYCLRTVKAWMLEKERAY